MCHLTCAAPARRAEGSHFSSGKKSADELILMKELDTEGDCAQRVVKGVCMCVWREREREGKNKGPPQAQRPGEKQMLP